MKKLNKLLIKYEPLNCINLYNTDLGIGYSISNLPKEFKKALRNARVKNQDYLKNIFETERFIGYTIVGKIENDSLYIGFSLCNYDKGEKFVKKIGVEKALEKMNNHKYVIQYVLYDVQYLDEKGNINMTVVNKLFHKISDNIANTLYYSYGTKKLKYWLSKMK